MNEGATALTRVDALCQRGTEAQTFGIFGAIAGGLAGGVLGLAFSGRDDSGGDRPRGVYYFAAGALGGGTVGFALGAAVGALMPAWRPRYP